MNYGIMLVSKKTNDLTNRYPIGETPLIKKEICDNAKTENLK